MKLTLILKANISRRRRFFRDLKVLESSLPSARIEVLESTYAGHSVELAEAACADSDYMVAVGGDGTLNEVLNGCMRYCARHHGSSPPVFGLLAYGRGNDFARAVGLEGTVKELCALLRQQSTRRIDVGRVACQSAPGQWTERYFHNIADVGIGASVVQSMDRAGKGLGGGLAYLWALLKTFVTFRHVEIEVETDTGFKWQGLSLLVVAANGNYFGSGLCVAPGARVDDGKLAVTLVGRASAVDFIFNFGRLKKGIPLDHPEAQYLAAKKISIGSEPGAAAVEADGETIGFSPAVIEVIPDLVAILSHEVERPVRADLPASRQLPGD